MMLKEVLLRTDPFSSFQAGCRDNCLRRDGRTKTEVVRGIIDNFEVEKD